MTLLSLLPNPRIFKSDLDAGNLTFVPCSKSVKGFRGSQIFDLLGYLLFSLSRGRCLLVDKQQSNLLCEEANFI